MSDDDMDSGIDGHVPSLEPLFEEDDYIVVDKDVNLGGLTIGEPGEYNKTRGDSLEGCCSDSVHESPYSSPRTSRRRPEIKSAAFRIGGETNLESFGCYQESLAANWKPGNVFRVDRRCDVEGQSVEQGVLGHSTEWNQSQSVRKRNTEVTSGNSVAVIRNHNDSQTYPSSNMQKGENSIKTTLPKNPSLTSFDKLVKRSKKKKQRRKVVDLWQSSSESESLPRTISKESCSSNEKGIDSTKLEQKFSGCNKNILILPEIDEFKVEDADEEELWNGEEDCEAGSECDEILNDD